MSDMILVQFKMRDPNHNNEEVIRWMSKILRRLGIADPEFWVWELPESEVQEGKQDEAKTE